MALEEIPHVNLGAVLDDPMVQDNSLQIEAQKNKEAKDKEDEEKKVKWAEKLLSEAKQARSKYSDKWPSRWKMYEGDQWEQKRPSYRHSEVVNITAPEVQNVIALLTDSKPTIETLPEEPSDFEFSEMMTQLLRGNWEKRMMSLPIIEAGLEGAIYGTGGAEVYWNEKLEDGIGDYNLESLSIYHLFPDPNCRNNLNDKKHCSYVIKAEPVSTKRLKADYPDKKDVIKADLSSPEDYGKNESEDGEVHLLSPVDKDSDRRDGGSSDGKSIPHTLKITVYARPEAFIDCDWASDKEDENSEDLSLKYPNGLKLVVANKHVLEEGPLDDKDLNFPIATYANKVRPRCLWGDSDVEDFKSPQIIFNKVLSYILDVLTLMGNPIWVVDTGAGIDTDELINQPGLVVEKATGSEVRREEGVQLPPYIMQLLDTLLNSIWEKVRTTSDVSQGNAPSPTTSGFAIQQLAEAAQTRIRSKSRNMDFFLMQIANLQINYILSRYTVPRVVRLTNNPNAQQYFKMSISDEPIMKEVPMTDPMTGEPQVDEMGNPVMGEQDTGETRKIASVQSIQVDPVTKQPIYGDVKNFEIKGRLDLRSSVGTTLPINKANKANTAKELYNMQVYDGEDLLNDLEIPNKDRVLEKLKQRQLAEQQMAMQAPPPGPGGEGPVPT